MKKTFSMLMLFFFLFPIISFAGSFRCGGDIISAGDSTYKVTDKCGEPESKRIIGYTSEAEGNNKYVIEEWVYKKGIYRYIIRMTGNKVTSITDERTD